MLSAVIRWESSYPAMRLISPQLAHQGFPHPSPLVLGTNLLKSHTGIQDRDRAVLRRSEPSSRTALTGEQPDPWELLRPQDAMSRHRCLSFVTKCSDYIFILSRLKGASLIIEVINFPSTSSGRNFYLHYVKKT